MVGKKKAWPQTQTFVLWGVVRYPASVGCTRLYGFEQVVSCGEYGVCEVGAEIAPWSRGGGPALAWQGG